MPNLLLNEIHHIPAQKLVTLAGEVSSGAIESGMQAFILIDSALYLSIEVKAVEMLDESSLRLSFGDDDWILLQDLVVVGTMIEVNVQRQTAPM